MPTHIAGTLLLAAAGSLTRALVPLHMSLSMGWLDIPTAFGWVSGISILCIYFFFSFPYPRRYIRKKYFYKKCPRFYCLYSSRILMVLNLTSKSLILFEFSLVYGVRMWSKFTFCPFYPSSIYWILSLYHWIFLTPLSNINWLLRHGFISGLSTVFHWSICLVLCQYHAVLIIVAL